MIKVEDENIQDENIQDEKLNNENDLNLNDRLNQKEKSLDSKDGNNFNVLEKSDNQDQDKANKDRQQLKSDYSQLASNLNKTDTSHVDEHLIKQKLETLSITSQLDKTQMLDNSVTKPEVIGLKMKKSAGQGVDENKVLLDFSNIEEEAQESNSEINDGDDEYEDVESEQSDNEKKESDEDGSKDEYEEANDNADTREEEDEQVCNCVYLLLNANNIIKINFFFLIFFRKVVISLSRH